MSAILVSTSLVILLVLPGSRASAEQAPACLPIPVFERGQVVRRVCIEHDEARDVTRLDLGDQWVPTIFSETPDRPQSYRQTFVALANERIGEGRSWDTARRDRYFELYGIFPQHRGRARPAP